MTAILLIASLPACNRETRWPIICTPDDATRLKPEEGGWRRDWHWRGLDDRFVISREGTEAEWRYTVTDGARPPVKSDCALEPNSNDVVCDGERFLRMNTKTLRFIVAHESGFRSETSDSSDMAYIAIGHCTEGGG